MPTAMRALLDSIFSQQAKEELARSWRLVAAAVVISAFMAQSVSYWFGVAIEPMSRSLGWTHSALAAWMTVGLAANVFCAPIVGFIIDRYGARVGASISITLGASGFALVAAAGENRIVFYGAAALVFGSGSGAVVGVARALNAAFVAARGRVLGLHAAGTTISAVGAPLLVQTLIDSFGWRTGFAVMAVVTLMPLPLALAWLSNARKNPGSVQAKDAGVLLVFRQRNFWLLSVALALFGACFAGVVVHLVPLLSANGLSRAQATLYAGGVGLGALIGKLGTGVALDKYPAAWLGACLFLLNALAVFALAIMPSHWAFAAILLFGLAEGGIIVATPYCIAQQFGLASYGSIYAGILVVCSLAAAGPIAFSALRSAAGSFRPSLFLAAALLSAGSLLWFMLGRQQGRAGVPLKVDRAPAV